MFQQKLFFLVFLSIRIESITIIFIKLPASKNFWIKNFPKLFSFYSFIRKRPCPFICPMLYAMNELIISMKAILSAVVRMPSSFSQLSSPSRFHFHIKKIWGYIWRICLKIKNWISRSTTLTKARRRLRREIKSSFQELQTILNGLLTVLSLNIQGETILFAPFETAFYLII